MIGARELEVFLAAAQFENFSAAANKLHMSQPSISFQIHSLEQQLKVKLFHRIGHRIQLTQAGRDLIPVANEMMNLSTQLVEIMRASQNCVSGILNIGCTTTPGRYILPVLLNVFRQQYPCVQVNVETSTDRVAMEEKLLDKGTDFAIFGLPPKSKKLDVWAIDHDELVLCVPANHRWAERGAILPQELLNTDWVMREPEAATRRLTESHLLEHGINPEELNVVMVLGCPEGVLVGVENGCGVSFISRVAVQRSLALGMIKTLPVTGLSIQRPILLASNPKGAATRIQGLFRDFILSKEGQKAISLITGHSSICD